MRTTLDIAGDVLDAAKELARRAKTSVGAALGDLARPSLARPGVSAAGLAQERSKASPASPQSAHYGIRPLPMRGAVIDNELVDRLRDHEGV